MRRLLRSRRLVALLLIAALAFGPVGCGLEVAVPIVIQAAIVAGAVAFTVGELQKIESASLDIELKRLRLQGMRNGRTTFADRSLTDREFQQIREAGEVEINGQKMPVRFDQWSGFPR